MGAGGRHPNDRTDDEQLLLSDRAQDAAVTKKAL
jgi:hypothetical protein